MIKLLSTHSKNENFKKPLVEKYRPHVLMI